MAIEVHYIQPVVKRASKKSAVKGRSIVIIDDEKPFVESMAQLVGTSLDCPVHAFTKPEDALAVLKEVDPGVIVTDYFMPEIDGFEFINKASSVAPRAVFIMITGHDLNPINDELFRLQSVKSWLQKPIERSTLVAAILQAWPGKDAPASRK
jgi:FixJ family two-component response regulator